MGVKGTADGAPVYLVKGNHPALLAGAVRTLVANLAGDDTPSLAVEDLGADADLAVVLDACLTPPLFTRRRVVVVRAAGRFSPGEADRLVSYLASPLETTALVLVAGGGTVPPRLVSAVRKAGRVVDAEVPSGQARTDWVAEHIRAAPVSLSPAATRLLSEHLGDDLSRLGPVLETLAVAFGRGARIDAGDLEPYLGAAGSVALWQLTDAIDRGDAAAALDRLHRVTGAADRHPLAVLAWLHLHFAALLRLDGSGVTTAGEAAARLGMATFRASKALAQARRLGPERTAQAIGLLARADLDLKGAAGWPGEVVMEVLVARLCRLAPRAGG
ncbi:MAG: DNA polymerase III subunit delta, partial [Acidimicrobiales bacterium]